MTFEPWPDQRTPALAIVARGDQIEPKGPTEFAVRSQSVPKVIHFVRSRRDAWDCTCPYRVYTGRICIHIFAVRYKLGFERQLAPPVDRPLCDRCRSPKTVINGRRRNQSGVVQRFCCRSCGYRFSGSTGFRKRRASPERIALGLDLYFRGLSLRKVTDHLDQVYGLKVSAMTVYRWVTRFSTLAAIWMNEQAARTGERWHVDETVINVNGEQRYLWNILDADTRFLLVTHVSRARETRTAQKVLRRAKEHTPDRPKEIFTDGMPTYPKAIMREFGFHGSGSPHVRVASIRAKKSNNRIERFHGTEKERFKVMRAFDNQEGSASMAEGFRVHYNLVREHSAIGSTPAVAAGLEPIEGFRWLGILKRLYPSRSESVSPAGVLQSRPKVSRRLDPPSVELVFELDSARSTSRPR